MKKNILLATVFLGAALVAGGCGMSDISDVLNSEISTVVSDDSSTSSESENSGSSDSAHSEKESATVTSASDSYMSSGSSSSSTSTLLDTDNMFTERDLEQEADLSSATYIELVSGEDVTITSEGVYVISGSAKETSIIVEATDAKVQLVLDGVTITNTDSPAIYVKEANKVFVTTTDSENSLTVTGTFTTDGTTNTDAVIYSKDDIVLNGVGTLNIDSSDNGISGKDDLKITGGTYNITCASDAIEAKDSIRIYDGTFNITSQKDGLHSENEDDTSVGYIYIEGGNFTIDAASDGIQATSVLMINGGTFDIEASEGLEGTYVQINGGTINISASDDGINATSKSSSYDVVVEFNGGDITIVMGSGDTDGVDANGYIYVNGGTISITGNSAFDYDLGAEFNGGTIYVNGEEITEITTSMMGGGFGGGMGGFGGGRDMNGQDGQTPPTDGEMPEGFTPPTDGNMPQGQAPSGQAPNGQMQQNGNFQKGNGKGGQH